MILRQFLEFFLLCSEINSLTFMIVYKTLWITLLVLFRVGFQVDRESEREIRRRRLNFVKFRLQQALVYSCSGYSIDPICEANQPFLLGATVHHFWDRHFLSQIVRNRWGAVVNSRVNDFSKEPNRVGYGRVPKEVWKRFLSRLSQSLLPDTLVFLLPSPSVRVAYLNNIVLWYQVSSHFIDNLFSLR